MGMTRMNSFSPGHRSVLEDKENTGNTEVSTLRTEGDKKTNKRKIINDVAGYRGWKTYAWVVASSE